MNYGYLLGAIGVMSLITIFTRAFPFMIFGGDKRPSKTVYYLGNMLPPAIIAMLVVYCLRDATPFIYPYALPEIMAGLLVVILHVLKRNTLISIFGGTLFYMFLVQYVFV